MRTRRAIAAGLVWAAATFAAPHAFAAADEEPQSGFLASLPGVGPLFDLIYGRSDDSTGVPVEAPDPVFRDRLFLGGLEGIGATVLHSDSFRMGVRTRGSARPDVGGVKNLSGNDLLDVGAFGELKFDEWTLSASVGQGLGERSGGFAGDLGLKWASRFADRWMVEVGPELSWASDEYVAGLSDFTPRATAPGQGLQLYDPTPGARELTLSGSVHYSISDNWTVGGMVGAQRLMNEKTVSQTPEEENEFFGGVSLGVRF